MDLHDQKVIEVAMALDGTLVHKRILEIFQEYGLPAGGSLQGLDLDKLDKFEIIIEWENEFDIEIDDKEVDDKFDEWTTVQDAVDSVLLKIKEKR